ncbi:MAG TPA: DUF4347 domain-containing protein, partial [Gammaproteobacteria bacterium]|nr:DUF4347 domain-containing protein [Gammaproteobacteria bacterium]
MGIDKHNKQKMPGRPLIEEIEPRILYSADPLGAAMQDALPAINRVIELPPDNTAHQEEVLVPDARIQFGNDFLELGEGSPVTLLDDPIDITSSQLNRSNEFIFIDTAVDGYAELLEDLLQELPSGTQPEIILLNTNEDGFQQIADTLADTDNVSAIHIISHANNGRITLGSSNLSIGNIDDYRTTLASWGNALTDNGDILIYGCNLAASENGVNLVDQLANLTRADVAASDDLTGNASVGGDWELEYLSGEIEATTLAPEAADSSWKGVLATELTPTGEQLVNATTAAVQETSSESRGSRNAVAMDSAGNYVVVWSDDAQDGSGYGIFAQRYDATGTKQGGEFQIN